MIIIIIKPQGLSTTLFEARTRWSRNQQENFLSYDINEIINWSVICGSATSVSLDNTV